MVSNLNSTLLLIDGQQNTLISLTCTLQDILLFTNIPIFLLSNDESVTTLFVYSYILHAQLFHDML